MNIDTMLEWERVRKDLVKKLDVFGLDKCFLTDLLEFMSINNVHDFEALYDILESIK